MDEVRLLIVEDDQDISSMLKQYFSASGYAVEIATRGSEALEQAQHFLPNLIILDIILPEMDGYEVCRLLRLNQRTAYIPVIFLTQKDERSDKLEGLELGVDDYITKPFDLAELQARVQNVTTRLKREQLTDALSGLPTGQVVEEQLEHLLKQPEGALMDICIEGYDALNASDDEKAHRLMIMLARELNDLMDIYGNLNDFIGCVHENRLIIITLPKNTHAIELELQKRFERLQNELACADLKLSLGVIKTKPGVYQTAAEVLDLAASAHNLP